MPSALRIEYPGAIYHFINRGDRRAPILLAADAGWPHTQEENHGVRREFVLPVRQPVSV